MSPLALTSIAELLDILPDAVLMVDAQGRVRYVNPAVRGLLGYVPDDLIGQPLGMLLPPAARARHEGLVARFHADGMATMMGSRPVLSALHASGRAVPVSISICNLTIDGGERVSVAVVHDVSRLNTDLDRATAEAETDPLTGLGNRLRLSRRLQAMLSVDRAFALLFLDLRGFKPFNDRYGHAAGDEALRVVGRRLQAQVRDEDVVVRLGGDEFVVLIDGLQDAPQLAERAAALAASVTSPLRVGGGSGELGVDIGGAIRPLHGDSERDLIAAADRAMYAAKQSGAGYRLADS